jgi:UDP-N-acetylglucosamine/UDP-N-acetylgalactosamine diphosphorylase
MTVTTDRFASIQQTLETHDQGHLLRFFDDLDERQRVDLLDQLERIDLAWLDELIGDHVRRAPEPTLPSRIEPALYYARDSSETGRPYDAQHYRRLGEEVIRAGKLAAFTVAGGQGTRLG